ncbi:hypothetical protein POVCU2_0097740 [Plasmodium ovale curtisi]|uniref:Uncharacterized protein n=1 Tax=Plasmodium ovale curtisi TaxID=864141 RepID=A0A1A8X7Q9_PLAOA|nr:hypothetical protein POVCU2_0097740 [Plasmodium ovale curtisi]SBT01286.1 hypothetical protein POVCU1_065760 [Plasmodium ovale curtisi]
MVYLRQHQSKVEKRQNKVIRDWEKKWGNICEKSTREEGEHTTRRSNHGEIKEEKKNKANTFAMEKSDIGLSPNYRNK